jgi:D-aminopeptidase
MTLIDRCPFKVGHFTSGQLDAITDVAGISVGHYTLDAQEIQTGVTVVRAHQGSHYLNKVPAGATVINGFGKSVGLLQLAELGVLETPIALTNTFSVSAVVQAQIQQAVSSHPEIGRAWPTVNPVVFECNDGYLNDIQAMRVQPTHYDQAFAQTSTLFEQGAVGAGRGMSCFGLKGGIGSASRLVSVAGSTYIVGALVLSNFGKLQNLSWLGQPLGQTLSQRVQVHQPPSPEKGSIIMLLATDAPLDARQLRRLSLRAGVGLARTGSFFGHGSGDIALAFSTAYTVPALVHEPMPAPVLVHEQQLDGLFEAAAEAVEQSIICSLWYAQTVIGRAGHQRQALRALYRFT